MTNTLTARAALIRAIGEPFAIADVQVEAPRGSEVLVEVRGSGLCHSDINYATQDLGKPVPMLLGHEVAGVVLGLGPDVRSLAVGDHVVACLVGACGDCMPCRSGRPAGCARRGTLDARPAGEQPRITEGGTPVFQLRGIGGFASHTLIDEGQLVRVDKAIPFDRAALLGCGVVTGAGAVIRSAQVRPLDTVVVIGAGGVGLNAIQAAEHVGARRVIAIDTQPVKLELAKRFGATDVVNASEGGVVEHVMDLTGGQGVDHVFEVTGHLAPLKEAISMLGHRGTVYLIGLQRPGTVLDQPLAATESLMMGLEQGIRGVMMGSTNFKIDVPYFGDLYLQGRFNLDDLVSGTLDLDDINAGYDALRGGGVARSVITF